MNELKAQLKEFAKGIIIISLTFLFAAIVVGILFAIKSFE